MRANFNAPLYCYCVQTEEARAEAYHLMGVMNNLCTPKNGEILIAATQAGFAAAAAVLLRRFAVACVSYRT